MTALEFLGHDACLESLDANGAILRVLLVFLVFEGVNAVYDGLDLLW